MTETTARRLQVASLIRELRSIETDLYNAGGTDDSAQAESIRLAGDDVRSAGESLERAMAAMRNEQCALLGRRSTRRSPWYHLTSLLWVLAAVASLGWLERWMAPR